MKNLILFTLILISLTARVYAESFSFAVSCTIPAIPGVNAPPFPEKKEETSVKKEKETTSVDFIEETEKKEIMLANGEKYVVINKTIYEK